MKETVYRVKSGDTIEKIAKLYNVDKKMVFPQEIEPGDRVVINLKKTTCYVVKPGDSLDIIATKLKVEKSILLDKNIEPLFVGKHIFL